MDSFYTNRKERDFMGWTEERVELLKKLWMEGFSASQIAAELGDGVTRNAVIGKVHRLKLSARAKPTSSSPARHQAPRPAARRLAPTAPSHSSAVVKQRSMMRTGVAGATALAAVPEVETEVYVAPAVQELFIPEDKRLTLLQLNEHTCKWPIGDPLTQDFYFCGQHSNDGRPYCEFHSRRASHQVDKKRH